MQKINPPDLLNRVAEDYFAFVPLEYRRYCILNSQVCQEVLRHFDVASFLLPAQLWGMTDQNNYVVGFVGSAPEPNIWDGHVVCATNDLIFDASLFHLRHEYGIDLPDVVLAERFKLPTHAIARRDLPSGLRLWWHDAPAVPHRYPVLEDVGLVRVLSWPLIDHLETIFLDGAEPGERVAA